MVETGTPGNPNPPGNSEHSGNSKDAGHPGGSGVPWNRRAERIGLRDLVNAKTYIDPSRRVTARQWDAVCQCIQKKLRGDEARGLDFYCGSGAFTADLAEMIGGEVLGIDSSLPLIHEATSGPNLRFVPTPDGRVPASNRSIDVVMANHALSGLRARLLRRAVEEIGRVLKPGGLLVLIEDTAELPDTEHRVYRAPSEYVRLFPQVKLRSMNKPKAQRPRLSVMIGRMMADEAG